jgi:hypothetical protein
VVLALFSIAIEAKGVIWFLMEKSTEFQNNRDSKVTQSRQNTDDISKAIAMPPVHDK